MFKIVSFAWAGFGATFGPAMLCALFWRRSNRQGIMAGLVVGAKCPIVVTSRGSSSEEKYNALCHPQQENAYQAMKDFTREVLKYVPTVMMTVVDTIPKEEIENCRKICEEEIGATYRVREYIAE